MFAGIDLVNLSKCSRGLNEIISQELNMWKDLCKFHYQQTNINSFVNQSLYLKTRKSLQDSKLSQSESNRDEKSEKSSQQMNEQFNDLDWKSIYFKLKKRYGHREVYADMIHKCFNCKCLFWKVNKLIKKFYFNKIKQMYNKAFKIKILI